MFGVFGKKTKVESVRECPAPAGSEPGSSPTEKVPTEIGCTCGATLIRHSDTMSAQIRAKSEPGRKVIPAFASSPQFLSLAISKSSLRFANSCSELLFAHQLLVYISFVVLGQRGIDMRF